MTKIKVWVLSTCVPGENEPCLPNVFASEAEAMAGFDEYMRDEWKANEPGDDETCQPLPYPGDAVTAHEILSRNPAWGRWEITAHTIEIGQLLRRRG